MIMKKVIKKNKRRPFPYFNFFIPVILNKNKTFKISKYFKFTESAIYNFNDEDQNDINKLFGFSIGYHKKNSYRFGWRPNYNLNKIQIVTYEYHNGVRTYEMIIDEILINKWYIFTIKYNPKNRMIEYIVTNGSDTSNIYSLISFNKKYLFGYQLFLYFGGNKKAPHNITIYKD